MKAIVPLLISALLGFAGCSSDMVAATPQGTQQPASQMQTPATETTQQPTETSPQTNPTVTTKTPTAEKPTSQDEKKMELETATFGAGCFWCVEASFQLLEGVESVAPGYMGGQTVNPTYKQVCTGTTGHAEVIQIKFDPAKVSFETLLAVFFQQHDSTQLNRQGNDVGTQYRSAIFYHTDQQQQIATRIKAALRQQGIPVVTEVSAATKLYVAEQYHHNYFNKNQNNSYCRMVIPPKLEKLKKVFGDKLKTAGGK